MASERPSPHHSLQETAVLSKARALLAKTIERLEQLDSFTFPTNSSAEFRELLVRILRELDVPEVQTPVDSQVLYNKLIGLQELVKSLEDSTSEHISWPLVSYCDDIWRRCIREDTASIFYSITRQHNYTLDNYSDQLRLLLDGLLPSAQITEHLAHTAFYCLNLASMEDDNLPLYANIGHEFGHAIFDRNSSSLERIWQEEIRKLLERLYSSLTGTERARQKEKIRLILRFMARELFADRIAVDLMGPAFALSLHEMSWDREPCLWKIHIPPSFQLISAYPSDSFRIACISDRVGLKEFFPRVISECARLSPDQPEMPGISKQREAPSLRTFLEPLPELLLGERGIDYVRVTPDADPDSSALYIIFSKHLPEIKSHLKQFLDKSSRHIEGASGIAASSTPPIDVAQLIFRLHCGILPNIIPDVSLLGTPAKLQEILMAAAMYRMSTLVGPDNAPDAEPIRSGIRKIERLTSKSLEVSYIQAKYNSAMSGRIERL